MKTHLSNITKMLQIERKRGKVERIKIKAVKDTVKSFKTCLNAKYR